MEAFRKTAAYLKDFAEERGIFYVVPFIKCREAAALFGISPKEAELCALRSGLCPSRYERNVGTLGLDGQARLLSSCAAVAGCGGIGGWIVEMLARAGVGKLILIDGDTFCDNNLNRQLYSDEENIGAPKAEAAAKRVARINAAVETSAHETYLNAENGIELLGEADIVLDALDGNGARSAVFSACRSLGIPFVHGAVAGFYGEAAVLRPDDKPVWELTEASDKGLEISTGNPPFMPPYVAAAQAAEAIKILAGLEGGLRHTMLWFDLMRGDIQRLKI